LKGSFGNAGSLQILDEVIKSSLLICLNYKEFTIVRQ
jgi:hypothetical protein